jgi:hypothetical protein
MYISALHNDYDEFIDENPFQNVHLIELNNFISVNILKFISIFSTLFHL